jgi:hypothetical protein
MGSGPHDYCECLNFSREWREEERRLIAKGLLPGSNKLREVLYRTMRKKHGA